MPLSNTRREESNKNEGALPTTLGPGSIGKGGTGPSFPHYCSKHIRVSSASPRVRHAPGLYLNPT